MRPLKRARESKGLIDARDDNGYGVGIFSPADRPVSRELSAPENVRLVDSAAKIAN